MLSTAMADQPNGILFGGTRSEAIGRILFPRRTTVGRTSYSMSIVEPWTLQMIDCWAL
jgi:hypothetical protein